VLTGIAVGNDGAIYVAGYAQSLDFPIANALQSVHNPDPGQRFDGVVSKLNAAGTALVYSTYLGGNQNDLLTDIAVDNNGNAYIVGDTRSLEFPTVNPIQPAHAGGLRDGVVSKLNAAGNALVYSTYLGGADDESLVGIAVDSDGAASVAGWTGSFNFPTVNPVQPAHGGGTWDLMVSKLNAAGTALVYSTYLGGSQDDVPWSIAVDGDGAAYVTGYTDSFNFPTINPMQPTHGGGTHDGLVSKLNAAGTLVYSTYLGGSMNEMLWGIAVDAVGAAYVTGDTGSLDFPTVNPIQPAHAGGEQDAVVSKLNAAGTALVYSTYLGGGQDDGLRGIAVDGDGAAYVTGFTNSFNFPTVNPIQPTHGGGTADAVVSKLNAAGTALVYSTYLGGNQNDALVSIAVDGDGAAYVTGATSSADSPTANPLQPAYAGSIDGIIAKLAPDPIAPTAVAGPDISIRPGDMVNLDGTGSFDDDTPTAALLYSWTFVSVPLGSNAVLIDDDTATPSFVADLAGSYKIELIVTDQDGLASDPDTITVSSNNLAPTAMAGEDQVVITGSNVFLDGSLSSDPEMEPLIYEWMISAAPIGSVAGLIGANTVNPMFVPDVDGVYTVTLVVRDSIGPGAPDSLTVTSTNASTFAQIQIVVAVNIIKDLTGAQVTNQGNQNALTNFLSQAIQALALGDIAEAIQKLKNAIMRTDGCALRGEPDGNGSGRDWITDCAAQSPTYLALKAALDSLVY
jgi:hypothetical protein